MVLISTLVVVSVQILQTLKALEGVPRIQKEPAPKYEGKE